MSKCTGGCGKSKANCCCIKNYRGEKGDTGDRGPRGYTGAQGPPGADAEILMSYVDDNTTQDIDVIDGQTVLTNMTIPVAAGSYAVWAEASIYGNGTGSYGIYLDGILQGYDRALPGDAASISVNNGLIVSAGAGNITFEATVTLNAITKTRCSLIVQKIA